MDNTASNANLECKTDPIASSSDIQIDDLSGKHL